MNRIKKSVKVSKIVKLYLTVEQRLYLCSSNKWIIQKRLEIRRKWHRSKNLWYIYEIHLASVQNNNGKFILTDKNNGLYFLVFNV